MKKSTEKKPALREGEDYYVDSLGRYVFTREYHLKRGTCCGSGCRHCPYGNAPGEGSEDEVRTSPDADPLSGRRKG